MRKHFVFLLFVIPWFPVRGNSTQVKNTQWFEDTIDEFLRQAQNSGDASDIQVSTCKITSQQLVATAQATALRVLKGVCNPNEIEEKFQKLESQLGEQLNSLKTMIAGLERRLVDQDQELKQQHRRVMTSIASSSSSLGTRTETGPGGGSTTIIDDNTPLPPAYIPPVPHRAEEITEYQEDPSSSTQGTSTTVQGSRVSEIKKYNSTVYIENGKRVFSYYWFVGGLSQKLNGWGHRRALRSNNFYVFSGGYRMYLKIIPRYSDTTTYIHVGITKGDYDEYLEWPFRQKMRVSILSENGPVQDLKSRIWDPTELCSGSNWRKPVFGDNPECVGLGMPHEVITATEFSQNNRIIIKLNVYLD